MLSVSASAAGLSGRRRAIRGNRSAMPSVRWSDPGNGRPARETAAMGSSRSSNDARYAARIAVLADVIVVAATSAATRLQRRMGGMVYVGPDAP